MIRYSCERLLERWRVHYSYLVTAGVKSQLSTTAANLDQQKTAILLQELPATFRGAVRISRTLGVQYLWIDSLCIIQHLESDWKAESAKMHKYYQNVFVTIGAHPRKGQAHDALQLSADENVYLHLEPPNVNHIYKESVLESRAWCLQERMMSTRTLQFGRAELLWECNMTSKREADREAENVQLA